jgi:hypothetical protein
MATMPVSKPKPYRPCHMTVRRIPRPVTATSVVPKIDPTAVAKAMTLAQPQPLQAARPPWRDPAERDEGEDRVGDGPQHPGQEKGVGDVDGGRPRSRVAERNEDREERRARHQRRPPPGPSR